MAVSWVRARREHVRARDLALGCSFHDIKVAMSAWELKCTLSCGRLDCQVRIEFITFPSMGSARDARARGRAWCFRYCPPQESRHVGVETIVNP